MEILGLNLVRSIIIILIILLYWKFVYYPYHKKNVNLSLFLSGTVILFFIGIYSFFFAKTVAFYDIAAIYSLIFIFMTGTVILEGISLKDHKLDGDVDLTLALFRQIMPFIPHWFWLIIAFPALFFIAAGTYTILGKEHVLFWAMIFIAWVFSDIRLYHKRIAK